MDKRGYYMPETIDVSFADCCVCYQTCMRCSMEKWPSYNTDKDCGSCVFEWRGRLDASAHPDATVRKGAMVIFLEQRVAPAKAVRVRDEARHA